MNVPGKENLYISLFFSLYNTLDMKKHPLLIFFQNLAEIILTPIIQKLM